MKDGVVLPQWDRHFSMSVKSATVDDSGIYECYSNREDPHAIMRLLVRSE